MITHKYEKTQQQIYRLHPRLFEIVDVAAHLAWIWYADDLQVTAIYDPKHPGTTHRSNERRFRFLDASLLKTGGEEGSERLRETINTAYPYMGSKPHFQTVPDLHHEGTLGGSTAPHFHFQIAPRWIKVDPYPKGLV